MLAIAVICAIYSIRRYFNLMMCPNLRDVEALDIRLAHCLWLGFRQVKSNLLEA